MKAVVVVDDDDGGGDEEAPLLSLPLLLGSFVVVLW
jgi:hypothetical protein